MILFILRLTLHVCCGSITRNFKLISGSTFNMFVCFQLTEYTITIFPKKKNLVVTWDKTVDLLLILQLMFTFHFFLVYEEYIQGQMDTQGGRGVGGGGK